MAGMQCMSFIDIDIDIDIGIIFILRLPGLAVGGFGIGIIVPGFAASMAMPDIIGHFWGSGAGAGICAAAVGGWCPACGSGSAARAGVAANSPSTAASLRGWIMGNLSG